MKQEKIIIPVFLLALASLVVYASTSNSKSNPGLADSRKQQFNKYWNQGKAELNHFEITQARYGELHKGYEVIIFVTEPFLFEKQVKLDTAWRKGAVNVFKINRVRRFTTGVYDYSMMTSVFKPVDVARYPRSLKTTLTSQDWCGHNFMQFNLRDSHYLVKSFSYFESEADQNFELEPALLEDEILNTIRLSPSLLPVGKVRLIPSSVILRLRHKAPRVVVAMAALSQYSETSFKGENLYQYSIKYANGEREATVVFENKHPYKIAGYKDTYKSGFGAGAKVLTTTAKRTRLTMSPYWQENKNKHLPLRGELGLKPGI